MPRSLFSVRRFLFIFIIAWLFVMADHAVLLYWFGLSMNEAIIDSTVNNLLLLGACLLIMNTIRYYVPSINQYLNVLFMCIALTVLWMVITKWTLRLGFSDNNDYLEFLKRSMVIRASIGFLIMAILTMVAIIWFNWQEQQKNEERKVDAERLAREAELFKLRQQLQPHFLFNSLNSINALIGQRPAEARKMVQQLSDFLRGTIKKEETQWVTLQEEMQYLQLYLDIEKVRFGNRLETDINTTAESLQMKLPALLLQPVVENAIKFGLYDTIGETIIGIRTYREEDELVISVCNPYDPETSSPRQGTGFGLKSVNRRLYLLFARTDLLTTESKENIFTITVRIPALTEPG